jgi:hypothetical protein
MAAQVAAVHKRIQQAAPAQRDKVTQAVEGRITVQPSSQVVVAVVRVQRVPQRQQVTAVTAVQV